MNNGNGNGNGKPKYNTPNSTQNQTVSPNYRPEQAVPGSGMARRAAARMVGRKGRMARRLRQAGLE